MWWMNTLIVLLLLQSLIFTGIDGNANRRHRRRRQTSGSLYGTNAHLGASAPAGYNYPANTNIQGTKLNNPDARDLYASPFFISSAYTEPSLNSVNLYNQPRPAQQQVYGTQDQSSSSGSYYGAGSFYGSGTNQLLRDPNGNLLPPGSSFYSSSNTQLAYPPNPNEVLTTKDVYNQAQNPNSNNNQYPYGSNQLPNSNTYGGPSGSNTYRVPSGSNTYGGLPSGSNTYGGLPSGSNTYGLPSGSNSNLPPNTNNIYGGSIGGNSNLPPNTNMYKESMSNNNNLPPNTNSYGGSMGTNSYYGSMGTGSNANSWMNQNSYYRYNQNPGNNLYPSRDTNYNPNTNNRYSNNNAPFYYNNSCRSSTSILVLFLSIIATIILQF